MNENRGHIALHRALLDWEWYGDINTCRLFVHLLLTANYSGAKVKGRMVRRGQRLCSLQALASETGLSVQQARTALDHLKSTGEVTSAASPQGTVITVKNYDKYQSPTSLSTSNQQTTNKQSNKRLTNDQQTTSNKNNNIPPISPKGEAYSDAFLSFWSAYPRKVGKGEAWKVWKRLRPDGVLVSLMLNAVALQRGSPAWERDGGQYIPHPATWLRQRRWEDETDTREGGEYDEYI